MALHFEEVSAETQQSDIVDLSGLIIKLPLLKTRSIGEMNAGTLKVKAQTAA